MILRYSHLKRMNKQRIGAALVLYNQSVSWSRKWGAVSRYLFFSFSTFAAPQPLKVIWKFCFLVFCHLKTWLESICRALLRYSGCLWPRQRGWNLHFEEQVGFKSFQLFLCLSLLVQPDEGVGGGLLGQLHLHQDGGGGGRVLLQGGQHSWNYWVLCKISGHVFCFSLKR